MQGQDKERAKMRKGPRCKSKRAWSGPRDVKLEVRAKAQDRQDDRSCKGRRPRCDSRRSRRLTGVQRSEGTHVREGRMGRDGGPRGGQATSRELRGSSSHTVHSFIHDLPATAPLHPALNPP
jgi:hypothetical protein